MIESKNTPRIASSIRNGVECRSAREPAMLKALVLTTFATRDVLERTLRRRRARRPSYDVPRAAIASARVAKCCRRLADSAFGSSSISFFIRS